MARIYVVVGLGYGDEGKGTLVDFLARSRGARLIVRYNGGPQAAHHVVLEDGRWHAFSQFGSGTMLAGVRTHLSREMLVKPANLLVEAQVLGNKSVGDAMERLSIDPGCAVVTPLHAMIGQMLEVARGGNRLGSVGMGVGQAVLDRRQRGDGTLCVGDFQDERGLRDKLGWLWSERMRQARDICRESELPEVAEIHGRFVAALDCDGLVRSCLDFTRAHQGSLVADEPRLLPELQGAGPVVFEGAHGTLLDPEYGFSPHVTRVTATAAPADALLARLGIRPAEIVRIGVLRAYATRHGSGPFVTEEEALGQRIPEVHNVTNPWQGPFRLGWLDLVALRYGIAVNPPLDGLAVTNLDRLSGLGPVRVCVSYEYMGRRWEQIDPWFEWERFGGRRVRITAIKVAPPGTSGESTRTSLLMECRPLDFLDFPGWEDNLGCTRRIEALPAAAQKLLAFLESREGLGTPVAVVSVGPRASQKLEPKRL